MGQLISISSPPAFLPSVSGYRVLTASPIFAEGGNDFLMGLSSAAEVRGSGKFSYEKLTDLQGQDVVSEAH